MTTENEESFQESANSLPDSKKVNYEQKEAEVKAVSDRLKPLCISIEQISERKKFLENSKLMRVVYILFILGLAVNIFYEGVYGELKVGTVMMVLSAVGYVAYQYDLRNESKRAEKLRDEEEACLDKWLACGVSGSSFADLRELHLEEFALQQTNARSEAEMAEKRAALDIKSDKLWDGIRRELYRSAAENVAPA